jgi:hypothetical protein
MNMAKGSIRTFPKWERGTVENGAQISWLTTAGVMLGRPQLANIRRSECLMRKFFVIKIFIITNLVFEFHPFSLTLVGGEAICFSYLDSAMSKL